MVDYVQILFHALPSGAGTLPQSHYHVKAAGHPSGSGGRGWRSGGYLPLDLPGTGAACCFGPSHPENEGGWSKNIPEVRNHKNDK